MKVAQAVLLAAAAALALGAGYAARSYLGGRAEAPAASTAAADKLMRQSFPDLQGKPQALSAFDGKVIVINFWATWCGPCREEIPDFVRLQRDLGPRGVQFVGIAVDKPDAVAGFAKEFAINYPVLIGNYAAIDLTRSLGNRVGGLPYTVIIDRSGRLAKSELGNLSYQKLATRLEPLL